MINDEPTYFVKWAHFPIEMRRARTLLRYADNPPLR